MGKKKYDWSDLKELYNDRQLSITQIAQIKGCDSSTVLHNLNRFAIPRRQRMVAWAIAQYNGRVGAKATWGVDDLRDLYVNKGLNMPQIARLKGKSKGTIRYWMVKLGVPRRSVGEAQRLSCLKGPASKSWKGGKRHSNGYVKIYQPYHPLCDSQGYVFEHRLVMEEKLQRYLLPWEVVHHKNGTKDDNRLPNLEVFPNHQQHLPSTRWQQEMKERDERIEQLEKRVTLLEAENVILRQQVCVSE